jgi:hypothetical protein
MSNSTHLDYADGGHNCEYVAHPLGWTNYLADDFSSSRCRDEAVYITREEPRRYLCAKHAIRTRVPFRRANDQQLVHMAMETL